jgi:hypothetical protein
MEFDKQMFLTHLSDVIFVQAGCIVAAVAEKVVVGKVKIQPLPPRLFSIFKYWTNISQNGII